MIASAETFLAERAPILSYLPDDEALIALALPLQVLVSEQTRPVFQQAACQLAERLNVPVSWTPGTHTPYLDRPHELVRAIRPFAMPDQRRIRVSRAGTPEISRRERDKTDVERHSKRP